MQKGLTTNVKTCSNPFFKKKALVGDFSKYWTTSSNISHTPPEGRVRAEKILITFDTIFWGYLPRVT